MDLKYIGDYDELTWIINVDDFKFYECSIPWANRMRVRKWMDDNCSSTVYVWNGLLAPDKSSMGYWGDLISPDGNTCFFIFMKQADETRFAIEFAHSDLCTSIYPNGTKAYYSRKNKY